MTALAEIVAVLESARATAGRITRGRANLATLQAAIVQAEAAGQADHLRQLLQDKLQQARAVNRFGDDLDGELESLARLRPGLRRLGGRRG